LPKPPEEVEMPESKGPPLAADEFHARAERALAELEELRAEAEARSTRVQEELRRLRFDATQTIRVLRALRLPVPPVLTTVSLLDPDTVADLSAEEVPASEPPSPSPEEPILPPAPVAPPAVPPSRTVPPEDPAHTAPSEPDAVRDGSLAAQESDQRVLRALEDGPLSWTYLNAAARLGTGTLSKVVRRLRQRGLVIKDPADGTYRRAEPGEREAPQEFPEELRGLPASQGKVSPVAVEAARRQKAILAFVLSRPSSIVLELAERFPSFSQGMIGSDLRALADMGLISRTGKNRRPEGVKTGRPGVEYAPPEAPPSEEPSGPEVAPDAAREEKRGADLLVAVRDYATHLEPGCVERDFTDKDAAKALDLPVRVTRTLLDLLADRGIITDVSAADGPRTYSYKRPVGGPVNRPRQVPPEEEARQKRVATRSNGARPVEGTGVAQVKTGVTELDAIIRKVEEHPLGKAKYTGGQHIALINTRTGQRVIISKTPGASGSPDKTKKRLAAIGLSV
jgi:DNA-binding HxlR family transcriptional regulator